MPLRGTRASRSGSRDRASKRRGVSMDTIARRILLTGVAALGAAGLAAVAVAQKKGAFADLDERTRKWFRRRRESGEPVEKALAAAGTAIGKWFVHAPAALFAGGWVATKSGMPAGAALPA